MALIPSLTCARDPFGLAFEASSHTGSSGTEFLTNFPDQELVKLGPVVPLGGVKSGQSLGSILIAYLLYRAFRPL